MSKKIPVYDICAIDQKGQKNLLIERFGDYLEKHYQHLQRPHGHSFYHLVLFTKGRGTHTIDFEKFSVKPFQIYFMSPGQVHSWNFVDGVDGYIVHFNQDFIASFLHDRQYLEKFSFFKGIATDSVCRVPVFQQDEVAALFESMLGELAQPKDHSLVVIRLRLLELFIKIDRSCKPGRKHAAPQKLTLLRSFQHLVEKQFKTIKLPKEYADLLYITPNHLNALCRDVLGKTAGEVIRDRILLEAKRLLTHADMTVTEIAYDLNFHDNSYFNRFFKKYVGMTPDEFRKKIINS